MESKDIKEPGDDKQPFVGLRPFQEEDQAYFFGRDEYVDNLSARVRHHRFTAIVGAPGTGKTSLIQAGLIPVLKSGHAEKWTCVFTWPGKHPFGSLATSLASELRDGDETELNLKATIESDLQQSSKGLADILDRNGFGKDEKMLIVIDQFEEIFENKASEINHEEIRSFVSCLLGISRLPDYQIHVVVALRTDFLERGSLVPGLSETINQNQQLIPSMSSRDLRLALKRPFRACNVRLPRDLEDRILSELDGAPFALTRLQHAMQELYKSSLDVEGDEPVVLTEEMYESIGGVTGSLHVDLEKLYNGLGDEGKNIVEVIFRRLMPVPYELEGVGMPTVMDVVELSGGEKEKVVEVLGQLTRFDRFFIKVLTEGGVDEKLVDFNLKADSDESEVLGINLNARILLSTELIIGEWERL